ncbi:unnamed protein product, partial [Anisakis simplex]|uniref:Centromere protein T n=1 Tax=Anisakis simplex TaxID=6269 RepID=A0A0M3J2X2_ANISI
MSKRGGDDRIQTQQCTMTALETSKPISTVAFELIEDVIRKVCEELDESSDTLTGTQSAQSSSALITEPLRRRPGESRIVAPLRIRIKQVARKAREPRERRPARSKDYSPPGWGSTHTKHKPQDNSNQLSLTQALNALSQQKPSTSRGSRKSLTPSAIVNSSPAAIRTSARQRRNALKQIAMQSEESVSTPDVLCLDADVTAEESNVSEKRLSSITRTPCTAETIRARIKESEGLIADIGSFATQFYNESDFSSGRMSVSKHQDDGAEGFKLQVKEEQQDGDDGPSEPKEQPPETSQDGNATVGQSDGRPQRRKSVNYTRLYPELFPSKRRRRKSVRSVISDDEPINSTSASVVEKHSPPIIPIPFEQQQPPKGRKRSSRGKKDATLASILSSPGSDVARPDYNEMADSPMLSASERRRQKKSQQRSSHKKSTDSTTNEESLAQEDSEAATVNTPDQQLTEADGKEEPQNEMVELAAVSVAEETDMKDDSTLMVLKRKHDGSSAERKLIRNSSSRIRTQLVCIASEFPMRQQLLAFIVGDSTASYSIQSRRSSDCNAKLSVSLSAEMGQQT